VGQGRIWKWGTKKIQCKKMQRMKTKSVAGGGVRELGSNLIAKATEVLEGVPPRPLEKVRQPKTEIVRVN